MTVADLLLYGAMLIGIGPVLAAIVYVIWSHLRTDGTEE